MSRTLYRTFQDVVSGIRRRLQNGWSPVSFVVEPDEDEDYSIVVNIEEGGEGIGEPDGPALHVRMVDRKGETIFQHCIPIRKEVNG